MESNVIKQSKSRNHKNNISNIKSVRLLCKSKYLRKKTSNSYKSLYIERLKNSLIPLLMIILFSPVLLLVMLDSYLERISSGLEEVPV